MVSGAQRQVGGARSAEPAVLKFAGFGGGALILLISVLSFIWGVYSLKREVSEKSELLNTIQTANDELRRLKETSPPVQAPEAGGGAWAQYFDAVAGGAGVDKAQLNVASEKVGNSTDTLKETLFDVAIKKVSIKQVVRLAFAFETGARPVKLRNLTIDTKADPEGYMDATLSISAFSLIPPK